MMDYLALMLLEVPTLMRKDPLINDIYQSINTVINNMDGDIQSVFNERFVDYATGKGLEFLEYRLGISTDPFKSLDQRRSLIKARLKSKGKVKLSKIDNICESWINGQVDTSISEDGIIVKFVSVGGQPDGVDDLKKTLMSIIPSHFKIEWEYTYLTWDMFEAYDWTWDEFEAQNLTWTELEKKVT